MFEYMLRVLAFISFIICYLDSIAQTNYGNDWINPNQTYYKIKVANKGIYRLNHATLNQAIGNFSNINPKNLQLFKNGKEVAMYIAGENDNTFDNNDFIEFYGEPNDGELDRDLYTTAAAQPHKYFSLFTDTANYFLTVSQNTNGLRVKNYKQQKTGLTSETHVITESLGVYTDAYYNGKYVIAAMSPTEYQEGEGFMGSMYGKGQQQIRVLNTPNLYNGIGATPIKFETYVAGRSNASSSQPRGINHHLRVSVNNGTNAFIKKDTTFTGYDIAKLNFNISPNELSDATKIVYESVDDLNLGGGTDYQAVAYAKINYPRNLDIQNASQINFNFTGGSQNKLFSFTNNNKPKPIIWDLSLNERVIGEISGNNADFVLSANNLERKAFLYDSAAYIQANLSKVEMLNLNVSSFDKNFIIITHKTLLSGAQNYANYRTQKGYKPFVVTTDQLYDQFYYGLHHPLAIKNFVKYLMQFAANKPEYLLLLGKGYENNLIRSASGLANDLVPTYGSPPSDDLLTAKINNASLAPALATGRVLAKTNEEVEIYLNKLKNYEQYPDSLWRKKIIHISGGNDISENLSWANYQANMYNMAKGEYFGADTVNFHKNVNQAISTGRKQQIIKEVNDGAALLSFLGHGAHQSTEIDFGIPQEYNNSNKLLTFLVNGCTTGNMYIAAPSLGEKHVMYPEKGGIAWIGTSSEGIASYLSGFSTIFYQKAFNTSYGKSIATALKETKEQYQNPSDIFNIMHTAQYTFQGDPALKFYAPAKQDYAIENKDLYISPQSVTAISDEFSIAVVVKNLGKAINQPIKIAVSRTLPNNTVINYPTQNFTKAIFNTDTLFFKITGNDISYAGINKFTVKIDPDNEIDELSKTNNIATFEYNFRTNDANIIYPKNFGIVAKTDIELVAQSNNLTIGTAEYIFEIDTVKTFDSPWKKSSGVISTGFLPKWKPMLLSNNQQVYFWRVKLNSNTTANIWKEASFTYILDSSDGWNQSVQNQFKVATLTNLEFNDTQKKLEFAKTAFYTVVQTRGDDAPTTDERRYRSNPGGGLGFMPDTFTGFTILALNPSTLKALNYPSQYNFLNQDSPTSTPYYSGQYYYNTNNIADVDSLNAYIEKVPDGYYVIGYNGYNANLAALPQYVKDSFLKVGVVNIGNISQGEPYMFWGQKGAQPGTAIEKMADLGSTVPARSQLIRFDKTYAYPLTAGTYLSDPAGPATKWSNVTYEFNRENTDNITLDLIGFTKTGNMQVLQGNLSGTSLNLSNFDAATYPKMALRANFTDVTNRTPAQLKQIKFIYDEYAENTINPEFKNDFYKGIVQEGDSVKWEIGFQNLSKYPSDSTNVYYTLTKQDRSTQKMHAGLIKSLSPFSATTFSVKLPSIGLLGNNQLKLDFTSANNKDSYDFNNYLQQSFQVIKDTKEPIVDVAFDGKRIMNGEIVSPQPNILISLTDENNFVLLKDTTVMNIYLKSENDNYKRISHSSGMLSFTPASSNKDNKATIMYKPAKLQDGIYTLMVEAKDASGNNNKSNNYITDFEVINESAITNFYPYPNPFTTAMKFVFTLTGDKIPDKIKIQIMTVTGKIVREIFKEELGAIRIGNNISDFKWDGTDMYGDKLANGVYFYKVTVENNDKSEINHRRTQKDNLFKQNTGKIYLMR